LRGLLPPIPRLGAQEQRTNQRISNAGYTITALPLLAAKEWEFFTANGFDTELTLMQPSIVPAALSQGDTDTGMAWGAQVTFNEIADNRAQLKWQKSSVTKFYRGLLSRDIAI
jgi:hypothetical protein